MPNLDSAAAGLPFTSLFLKHCGAELQADCGTGVLEDEAGVGRSTAPVGGGTSSR